MDEPPVQRVTDAIRRGAYMLTQHAEHEREADAITMTEVEQAFASERLELLEEYPKDARGQSALFLGFTGSGRPLHAVIGLAHEDVIVLVTVYRPDPRLWHNWRRRV